MGLILILLTSFLTTTAPLPVVENRPYDFARGAVVKVTVPTHPLSDDAIEIQSIGNNQRFHHWCDVEDRESYRFLQGLTHSWKKNQFAESYLVYGKTTPNLPSETFQWEVIPFQKGEWSRFKQLRVMWHIAFGVAPLTEKEKVAHADKIRAPLAAITENFPLYESCEAGNDPFCDPKVIEEQRVFDGERVTLLYHHAPVRVMEENPHFMIIPKAHRKDFNELTEEEYLESMAIARKVALYFRAIYPLSTIHFFHKTGEASGQTVPHWHLHLLVVKEDGGLPPFQFPCYKTPGSCTKLDSPFLHISKKWDNFFQSCKNFVYLLLPHRKLAEDELKERVTYYQQELQG